MKRQPPHRPGALAVDARWDEQQAAWRIGAIDAQGRLDGVQRFFRQDASLLAEYAYVAGEKTGPYRRYHVSGELAREGELLRGTAVGSEWAYAASSPAAEQLRSCCVPVGAQTMHVVHEPNGWPLEEFFDREGRRLLPDGSIHPERPASVDEGARFLVERKVWETGERTATGRQGLWKWWSIEGQLLESAEFEAGKHHGVWAHYRDGERLSAWSYAQGVLHGSGWERVVGGTYQDARIASHAGHYTRGISSGRWQYLDAQGEQLCEADLGPGLDELLLCDQVFMDLAKAPHPVELLKQGDPARASLLRLRQFGVRWVNGQLPTQTQAGEPATSPALMCEAASERWIKAIRAQEGSVSQVLARLLAALMRGARPELLLREMASYLMGQPLAGLDLVNAALSLDETLVEALATKALLLLEAGRVEEARQVQRELVHSAPDGAESIEKLLGVVFPRFDFWPLHTELIPHIAPEIPQRPVQHVDQLRHVVSKLALRVHHIRDALQARLSEFGEQTSPDWLPPDLSELVSEQPTQLDVYTFEAVFPTEDNAASEIDLIAVDEQVKLDGFTITELMRRARVEWTAMCWICYSAGLESVQLPLTVDAPATFAEAITTAFARHFRLEDQLQTAGLRSRAKGVPSFAWQGMPIESLTRSLLIQARDEYLEMRAALFFSADSTCRSLWQDDLRG